MTAAPYRIEVGTDSVPVRFVRNRRSRRYILRLQPDGTARVTIPRGGTLEYALEFARKNTTWLERQIRKTPSEWKDGTIILLRGTPEVLRVTEGEGRVGVRLGCVELELPAGVSLRGALEAHLRVLATEVLSRRTLELAVLHGLAVGCVSVRNQASRWGSCSVRKTIALNWRLIQTPDFVRDYIIIHELMHLREMNHSPAFWAHVQQVCPDYLQAEKWLRKHGRSLR